MPSSGPGRKCIRSARRGRSCPGRGARKSPGAADAAQASENAGFSGAGNRLESGWKVACQIGWPRRGPWQDSRARAVGMRAIVPPHGRVLLARVVHRRARLRPRIVAFVRVSPTRASASRASARSCGAAPDAAGGDGGARTAPGDARRVEPHRPDPGGMPQGPGPGRRGDPDPPAQGPRDAAAATRTGRNGSGGRARVPRPG